MDAQEAIPGREVTWTPKGPKEITTRGRYASWCIDRLDAPLASRMRGERSARLYPTVNGARVPGVTVWVPLSRVRHVDNT